MDYKSALRRLLWGAAGAMLGIYILGKINPGIVSRLINGQLPFLGASDGE